MENKERFDQIESLLVGVIQRMEQLAQRQEQLNTRQEQFNTRQEQFNTRQEQFNTRQEQFNARQEQFNAGISDQLGDVISILKLSAAATRQSEEQQDKMLRQIEAQGRRTDATQVEILRLMQKWDEQDARNQVVEKRLDATDSHEPRIQRLEDETLRQAS